MLKSKLSLNTILLLVVIVLFLVSGRYAWGYRQASQELDGLQGEVETQRRVLKRLQQSGDLEALRQQLAALERELTSEKLPFPQGDVSLDIADLIVQAVGRSGVGLTGLAEASRDSVTVGGSKYHAIRYQLSLQGTVSQFQDFLGWIEATTRDESRGFYLLRSLVADKLRLANKGGGVWSYNLEFIAYTQL